MRMKKSRRWLSALLAVLMLLTMIPTVAFAANDDTSGDSFYKIVHVDAGRKYFSPENLKKIIDNAATTGFNQVELYLSDNQGFRFALDDMTVTTSTGKTYDLTPALGDGYRDGSKYPDGSGKYLTQSEMDDIINYAKGKGIEIVPCINVPGHMGAILEAFTQFKYSGSKSSIDLENAEAVAFALAITEKYATYFENQGVKFYNLGADEYANDLSTMGFQGLYTSGKYQKFVDFLNSAAQIVINHGMTPRAFNDGLYYNEDKAYSVNSAIQVCYWSCGWSGYNLASAQYLVNQGLDVINTHGDYYWVLGNSSWQCSAQKASQFNYTSFQYRTGTTGNGTISNPAGAMFCIWCDVGNANGTDGGTAVVSATADVIAAFGATEPKVTVAPLSSESISDVQAMTLNGTQELSVGESATWTSSNVNVVSLASKTRSATDTSVIATAEGVGTATITATTDTKVYTADITVTAADSGSTGGVEVTANKTITVTAGQTATATISDYNFAGTYTTEDPSIATVNVTGKDATDATATYTKASVTCNDLIKSNSNNWTAVSGYYYKADDGNYYPVYAKRSSSGILFKNYTYTWGYSKTDSLGDVTPIGTAQSTYNPYDAPSITVYTSSTTDGTSASTIVTFNGHKVGTTYVTVGNTRYTINVVAEDLSKVTPLTVEFWITNQRVTANDATSMTIAANASGVYSESGAKFSDLVPDTGIQGGNTMVFWKGTRLASNNKQTTGGGVDKTKSGTDFTYIRYWDGSWAYSADGETWTNVASGDQIVAYYLQKTEVTDEITTLVSDYGNVPGYGTSLSPFVMVDYAVKYESGELTPSSFPTSKTIAFHCNYGSSADLGNTVIQDGNTYYRKLGTIKAVETADYEVYMITLTPTSDTKTETVANNANEAIRYTYDGTEKVIWVDDEANLGDFADESLHYTSPSGNITYTVGGEPNIAGLEVYKNQCMLVTYYVRAKVTEDSLAVHYIDQTANQEFYSYNIAVKSGTLFNENIGLANPWKGDLVNGSVTNLQDKTQTVSADLSTMPAIGAQYRYSDYTCVEVERSEGGKDVYLYYTFNNAKSFVIDFGLPLKITTADLGISGDWTSASVAGAKYGTATATVGEGITYTPTKVLKDVESLQLTLTGDTGSVTHQIYIYPASSVLYEDGFFTEGHPGGNKLTNGNNNVQSAENERYGYDTAYSNVTGQSNTAWTAKDLTTTNKSSDKVKFSFNGTGLDLIGECGTDTGMVYVAVVGPSAKAYIIDTYYSGSALHQVPLLHTTDLSAGNYVVTAWGGYASASPSVQTAATFSARSSTSGYSVDEAAEQFAAQGFDLYEMDDVELIYFDEGSVLAELNNASMATYAADSSDNGSAVAATRATTQYVALDAFRVYRSTSDYKIYEEASGEYGATYVNVLEQALDGSFTAYVDNKDGTYTQENYESSGGPQNEVYLRKTNENTIGAIAFKTNCNQGTQIQISARAVNDRGTVTMVANGTDRTSITSNTEMYYPVTVGEDGIVTIQSNDVNLLALGNLKLPENANTQALSEDDEPVVFRMLRAASVEPEPEPEPEPEVFTPNKFDIKVNSTKVIRNKVVNLTVTTSTDVEYLMVNGKKVKPSNSLLVKWGISKNYVFVVSDIVKRDAVQNYTIQAYNADGLASAEYTAEG